MTISTRSKALRLAVPVAAIAMLAAACSNSSTSASSSAGTSSANASGTWKIATMYDLTGNIAPAEVPGQAGFKLAFQQVNDQVAGHKVVFVDSADAQSTAAGGASAAVQIVTSSPDIIFSGATDAAMTAAVPTFKQAGIPVISSVNSDSLLGSTPASWYFSTVPADAQMAVAYASGIKALLGGSLQGKRVGFVGISIAPATLIFRNELNSDLAKEGGSVVSTQLLPSGAVSDFTSGAANLVSAKPDAIVDLDSPANSVVVAKALAVAGYKGPIIGSSYAANPSVLSAINSPNFYAPSQYPLASDSKTLSALITKYDIPAADTSTPFQAAYVAGVTVVKAMTACGYPCPPAKFKTTLESLPSVDVGDAAFGPVRFTSTNHTAISDIQFYIWDASTKAIVTYGSPIKLG